MEDVLTDTQLSVVKLTAESEDLENTILEMKRGGDSSFGVVLAVTAKGNNDMKLELIVKAASRDKRVRKRNPVRAAYLREIYMYNNIFPAFRRYERQFYIRQGFSGYPTSFCNVRAENEECIVLENLMAKGFKLHDRKIPMNSEHVSLVMAEYAKFHGCSLAMNYLSPSLYRELTRELTNIFDHHSLVMAKAAIDLGKRAVQGNTLAIEALDGLLNTIEDFLSRDIEQYETKLVIIHKDGWNNNFLFKYAEKYPEKPTETVIIDWQLAETGTPVIDLSYFIFTCGTAEVIRDYMTYLELYHKTATIYVEKMRTDINKIFPLKELILHWEKYSKFGLIMAIIMLKLMISEDNEVPTISHLARNGYCFADRLNFTSIHENEYNKRVAEIIDIAVEKKLI